MLLVAGGSGVVPLMAMVRARRAAGSRAPFRLLYSVRTPADVFYADELRRRVRDDPGLDVAYVYTREAPQGWRASRTGSGWPTSNSHGWPPELEPLCYVCGPTGFVETVADLLVGLGHDAGGSRPNGSARPAERRGGAPDDRHVVPGRQHARRPAARAVRRRPERRRRAVRALRHDRARWPACGSTRTRPAWSARCPGCAEVMLRLVRAPDRAWLDLRGATFLRVPMPPEQPHPGPL